MKAVRKNFQKLAETSNIVIIQKVGLYKHGVDMKAVRENFQKLAETSNIVIVQKVGLYKHGGRYESSQGKLPETGRDKQYSYYTKGRAI